MLLGSRPVRRRRTDKLGPLVRPLGKVVVDWEEGVVIARAGAAADLRLPGVDAPRLGAVRAARGRAAKELKVALAKIPLGRGRKRVPAALDAALERGQVLEPDYQTNGGVVLALGVQLAHLVEPPPAPAATSRRGTKPARQDRRHRWCSPCRACRSRWRPPWSIKGKPYPLASAVYRLGKPPERCAGGDREARRQGPPGAVEAARRPAARRPGAPSSTFAAPRSSA